MALKEALDNPKTFRLARIIGCEPWGALGLFEAIRQWMQTYRKNGGVTSEELLDAGSAIHFSGNLEDVLFRAGYLDVMERGEYTTYYFHDWESHCEDSVHMALARAGEYFANGSKPKMGRLSKEEREKAERLYAEQENAQCAQSVRTESALPNLTKPIDINTNNAGAREDPGDPWANDEGFSPPVMAADREWGNHLFRKYQTVRDSEDILADRQFLSRQSDPAECVNLAIRSKWKILKPVFGPKTGKAAIQPAYDEVRKKPDAENDYDVRAVTENGETVMKRFEKGSKTKLFDEAAWYASRGWDPPGATFAGMSSTPGGSHV